MEEVAVAEELNVGRTAARQYLTQPSLSRQIQALERLVGWPLVRRTTHRVELTTDGERFLDRVRDLDTAIATPHPSGSSVARLWAATADQAGADPDTESMREAFEAAGALRTAGAFLAEGVPR